MKGFLGIVLVFFGLLGYLFFGKYQGQLIPFINLLSLVSIGVMITGVVIITRSLKRSKKEIKSIKKFTENFKRNSKKLNVNLDNCQVISNNYTEELSSYNHYYEIQGLDAIYNSERNVKEVNINQALLLYVTEINGKKIEFYSTRILKDETTIKFLLARQKSTTIYFDPETENYYFDIEFLNNESENS